METKEQSTSMVRDVADQLGAIFRHMFPGVLLLGAAYAAFPNAVTANLSWELIAIAGVGSITLGNVLYFFNRYGIHQATDYLLFKFGAPGLHATNDEPHYHRALAHYIVKSARAPVGESLRQHLQFRAANSLFGYIIMEILLLFLLVHENKSIFSTHSNYVCVAAGFSFLIGLWQQIITRRVDFLAVTGNDADHRRLTRRSSGP